MVHIARFSRSMHHTYAACLRKERGSCLKKSVIDRIPIAIWRVVSNRRSVIVNKRQIHGFKAEECASSSSSALIPGFMKFLFNFV